MMKEIEELNTLRDSIYSKARSSKLPTSSLPNLIFSVNVILVNLLATYFADIDNWL